MGTTLNSTDALIASSITNGCLSRMIALRLAAATTAALTTCGGVTAQRWPTVFTVPSVGSGLTGMYITSSERESGISCVNLEALEYTLGTLTISGNSFAAGSSMPTKIIAGTSVVTATIIPMLVVTTALTATTPTITITYTDQDGNTGNSAVLVLPTNCLINTAFFIHPHLAGSDTGIRAITNMSTSAGSAGVLKVFGLLALSVGSSAVLGQSKSIAPLVKSAPIYLCEPAETIAFYRLGFTFAADKVIQLSGVAEN